MGNEVMVVTGTRKGIGRYLAQYYCDRGYQVVGCSRGETDFSHPQYRHFTLDIADERRIKLMFSKIRQSYGRLDILVNNAGIASMNHSLLTPLRTVQGIMNTNLVGTFLCSREAARLMMTAKSGRIVNFATVATPWRLEGESIYASSKAAVETLTRVMARELSDFGITVNAVGPTPVKTDLIRSVPEERIRSLVARQAVHRLGEFRDISNVIDFFISPESDFVTGQVIYLGGV